MLAPRMEVRTALGKPPLSPSPLRCVSRSRLFRFPDEVTGVIRTLIRKRPAVKTARREGDMLLIRVAFLLFALVPLPAFAQAGAATPAFPGAQGWAAQTPGGRGGRIIRVTNLNASGAGSFRAALEARGPRIVVFEVAGVIDMGLSTWTIDQPFLTIAGQTAPSPGITL